MTDKTNRNSTPNTPLRRISRFALVSFCLIAIYIIFAPLYPQFLGSSPNSKNSIFTSSQSNDINLVEIKLNLLESDSENQLDLNVEQITISDSSDNYDNFDQVCIQSLNTYFNPDSFYRFQSELLASQKKSDIELLLSQYSLVISGVDYFRFSLGLENICISPTGKRNLETGISPIRTETSLSETRYIFIPEISKPPIPLQFKDERIEYFFPFDRRSVFWGASLRVEATKIEENSKTIRRANVGPNLSLKIDSPNWLTNIEFRDANINIFGMENRSLKLLNGTTLDLEGEVTNVAYITQKRPLSQRLLTAVLLPSILIFILSLLFVKETGTFLEVAVGILLGLWGVQDILIPSYITGPTLINTLILAFYVLLAFVAAINFAIRPLWHRLGPPSQATSSDPEQLTPMYTPEPPAPTPIVIQPQKGVLQWITAVSATITAILAFMHFIRRKD